MTAGGWLPVGGRLRLVPPLWLAVAGGCFAFGRH